MQSILHGVLQPLAFKVVNHLVGGGLAHIQHGLSRHVLGSDLVTHDPPPASRWRRTSDRPADAAVGPGVESSVPGCPAAVLESAGGKTGDETGSVGRLVFD